MPRHDPLPRFGKPRGTGSHPDLAKLYLMIRHLQNKRPSRGMDPDGNPVDPRRPSHLSGGAAVEVGG